MLEAIEPGLFTMNVGNLLPQETAKITFRYAILYRWAGDRLRFFLPTTIAPRFGESPHLPHQARKRLSRSRTSSRCASRYSVRCVTPTVCPSHAVELVKSAESVVLSLRQPKAVMDRDFILNVKAPQATRSFVPLCGQDGDGLAAVASFQPFFPGPQQPRPLNLAIVIDCSGSMQGRLDGAGEAGARRHPRWAATARSNCADRVRQLDQRDVRSAASMQQDQPRQGRGLPRRSTRTWAAPRSATPARGLCGGRAARNRPTSFW